MDDKTRPGSADNPIDLAQEFARRMGFKLSERGISRRQAAALIAEESGHQVDEGVLRHWERVGLIAEHRTTRMLSDRSPVFYSPQDLARGVLIATLRGGGHSLRQIRSMFGLIEATAPSRPALG